MGLALLVKNEAVVGFKPFGTLDAVVTAQPGEVFRRLSLFEELQMARRLQIGRDLVDISVMVVRTGLDKAKDERRHNMLTSISSEFWSKCVWRIHP